MPDAAPNQRQAETWESWASAWIDADAWTAIVGGGFGVAAMVPGSEHAPDQLVQQADQALYAAKAAGRNRVHRAGERSLAPLGTQDSLLH